MLWQGLVKLVMVRWFMQRRGMTVRTGCLVAQPSSRLRIAAATALRMPHSSANGLPLQVMFLS